jgi:uncharacterized membrane protein YjgN (DUF898 family)
MAASAAAARARIAATEHADPLRLQFTGSGGEYFRIWVVNLLLTIVTCGVYSAWAKVRRLQYFYRNTRLDGSVFDYHGNPKSILKGRILALLLIVAYKLAFELSRPAAAVVALLLVAIVPWLLARSFRFKLINSSYRGLRFRFTGTARGAYKMLSLFPVLAALTVFYLWNVAVMGPQHVGVGTVVLGIALLVVGLGTVPFAHFLLKRFQHDNAYFGQTPVFFHATARSFFAIYARAIGFLLLGSVSAGIFGFLTHRIFAMLQATLFGWLFTLLYSVVSAYAFYLFVNPFLQARLQNLVWNQTEIGGNRFVSSASARRLLWIHATNLLFLVLSLGLYKPFAAMRLMKYRIESLRLEPDGNLEEFMCDHAGDNAGAIGQEAGDLFDIEIAL